MRSILPILMASIIGIIVLWPIFVIVAIRTRDCTGRASDSPLRGTLPVGIGFDLTAFYGTVAVTYANGSVVDVGRVEANSQYREVLKRLSLQSSTHYNPPYYFSGERVVDAPRQFIRWLRKTVFLPASADVGVLSTLVQDLRCKAEASLGMKLNSIPIVAATPTFIALYEEDIVDAFDYARLELASVYISRRRVAEICAAIAGHGQGLCSTPTDSQQCKTEIDHMPSPRVYSVLYTREVLRIIYTPIRGANLVYRVGYGGWTVDWDLGFDKRLENEEDYWIRVDKALQDWRRLNPRSAGPEKVFLLGDSAGDETFRRVLEEGLRKTTAVMPVIYGDGSEFIAARGAAELAKRSVYMSEYYPAKDLIGEEL